VPANDLFYENLPSIMHIADWQRSICGFSLSCGYMHKIQKASFLCLSRDKGEEERENNDTLGLEPRKSTLGIFSGIYLKVSSLNS